MTASLLQIAAVPLGLAAAFALALLAGRWHDTAASAAAGFATYGQPPYAPWTDQNNQDGDAR